MAIRLSLVNSDQMDKSLVSHVLPGTNISAVIEKFLSSQTSAVEGEVSVRLGSGLIQGGADGGIRSIVAGTLHYSKPMRFWVEAHQQRVNFTTLHCI